MDSDTNSDYVSTKLYRHPSVHNLPNTSRKSKTSSPSTVYHVSFLTLHSISSKLLLTLVYDFPLVTRQALILQLLLGLSMRLKICLPVQSITGFRMVGGGRSTFRRLKERERGHQKLTVIINFLAVLQN